MRCALRFTFPVEKFNAAVRDGTAPDKMRQCMEAAQPEAAYFWADGGKRGGMMIIDLPAPERIPSMVEPFMLLFDATIEMQPCMTAEDLATAGLEELGKKYG